MLTGDGHENQAYDVTGPAALNADDLAQLFAETRRQADRGRPRRRRRLRRRPRRACGHAAGGVAEIYATFGAATRSGVLDIATDVVERLTGRAPATVRSVLWP